MKFIITFGSGQLQEFRVRPNDVALVIEAENENLARLEAFNFPGIGERFCTSYLYDEVIQEFKEKYGMYEITLNELNKLRF